MAKRCLALVPLLSTICLSVYGGQKGGEPPSELAQLRDIHLPPPVGWWPLAPGWYVLGLLILLVLLSLYFFLNRYYLYGRARRKALQLLSLYQQKHQDENNVQITCARISELLKRVALVYFPRERVAGLQGELWLTFLNQTSKGVDFNVVRAELLEHPYHSNHKENDLRLLFTLTKAWISQRGKPCSS